MGWLRELSTEDEHPVRWLLRLLAAGAVLAIVTFVDDVNRLLQVALVIGVLILGFGSEVVNAVYRTTRSEPEEPAEPLE
jgi:hypothetical protein